MKKPVWFRWFDLLTLGLGAAVSFGLLLYAIIAGIDSPHAKEGLCLLAAVGLAFAAIYARFLMLRRAWLKEFTWYPTYGFMIRANGYNLPAPTVVEAIIQLTVDRWRPYHAAAGILRAEVNWVNFDRTLNEKVNPFATKLCKGFAVSDTRYMAVDFDTPDDKLEATAFEHEIGHVIRGNATGQWVQAEHHKFAADHGLK
jgi:hypothetical protein